MCGSSRSATSCARRTFTTRRSRREPRQEIPANLDPALRDARTIDGTYNDLNFPKMGSAGCRFGRNFPLDQVVPDAPNLLIPNPRVVSRELMTREQFQPATFLNLLAAAWIQFMVHDWFVHDRSKTDFVEIPTSPGDDFGAPSIRVPRSVPDAGARRLDAAARLRESEQPLVGFVAALRLRRQHGGEAADQDRRQAPHRADRAAAGRSRHRRELQRLHRQLVDRPGDAPHACSRWSTTTICDLLAHQHPDWNDEQLFRKARLINSALMAKIHTLEWTPAIVPHPIIERGMNVNWSGLAGEDLQDVLHVPQRIATRSAASSARTTTITPRRTRSPKNSSRSTGCIR